jgi:dinuclear metal center YbgI/SA1388 family protein
VIRLREIVSFLREFAPPELAEDWDNVGLLIGDPAEEVRSVWTCLTLTPNVADEAIAAGCQLIVTHHPVLFRPVQRLTAETPEGRMLLSLIRAGISVYSPHTSYDSAADGINAQLATLLNLRDVQPLRPLAESPLGSGRWGCLPSSTTLRELIERIKPVLRLTTLQYVGDLDRRISKLGIACGAAAEFLRDAARLGCDALLTGEARFHACLEAEASDIALILSGHYATERPAMERLAEILQSRFAELVVQPSRREYDPVKFA